MESKQKNLTAEEARIALAKGYKVSRKGAGLWTWDFNTGLTFTTNLTVDELAIPIPNAKGPLLMLTTTI